MSQMIDECYRLLTQPSLWMEEKSQLRFMVHEHQATTHHYDFRLLVGNQYLSWAIPKGPSLNPKDKRLAKETSLHSMACENKEGRIPAGQYGAGGNIVWDRGKYSFDVPEGVSPDHAVIADLQRGVFRFTLNGEKLKGEWLLQFWKEKDWLLRKLQDSFATEDDITLQNRSVLTQRTLSYYCSNTVVWVGFKKFYVAQHPQDKPIVLLRDDFVLDANAQAEAWKISPGMTARAARSILVDGVYLTWKPEPYVERQQKWLDVCADFSDVVEPYDQHSAFVDLSLHADPIATADDLTKALGEKMRLTTQVGLARTKWIAQLAVELDEKLGAYTGPREFVANLPVTMLLPALPEHRERLRFLGYSEIGQVAKIPFEVLAQQFEEQAYTIQQAAKGGFYEPVQAIYPPDSFADRWVFPEVVDSSETILAVCRDWANRIGQKLSAKAVEGAKVKLTIEDEDGTLRVVARNFSKPVRCPRTALSALLLMLSGMLDRPVLSLRLQIADLRKVKPHQGDLLQVSKDERQIQSVLRQVRTVFGDESVKLGREIQETRRVRLLREWKNAIGWR